MPWQFCGGVAETQPQTCHKAPPNQQPKPAKTVSSALPITIPWDMEKPMITDVR
jgi:hypothetical protein